MIPVREFASADEMKAHYKALQDRLRVAPKLRLVETTPRQVDSDWTGREVIEAFGPPAPPKPPRVRYERSPPSIRPIVRDVLMIATADFTATGGAAAILRSVASRHGLTVNQLKSKRRTAALVAARHEAAAQLAASLPGWTLPRIAKFIGYADHTCVIHALRKMGVRR